MGGREGLDGKAGNMQAGGGGGANGAQQVSRGPDHLKVDNIELGDNNGRLAQDTGEPNCPIVLIYKVQLTLLRVIR